MKTLNSKGPLKDPRPYGIHAMFYQKHWDIIGNDLVVLVQQAFRDCYILEEINKTYITSIPKKDVVETLMDYRPISLCNAMYKMITKIIARHIKPLLD